MEVATEEIDHLFLAGIPPWTDQDIVLYHGTTEDAVTGILTAVDVGKGNDYSDFGRGFYTTTRLDLALEWAHGQADDGESFAVVEFAVRRSDLAGLDCLFFTRGDAKAVDFWSFVQYSRNFKRPDNRLHPPRYDLVAGPVSGTWRRQTVIPNSDQISFHTSAAAALLDRSRKVRVI